MAAIIIQLLIGGILLGGLYALIAFGLVVLIGFVRRWATLYTVTNRRLYIKRGIVARHTQEAKLARVQNINTRQSVIERLLQVGTVDFDTAGEREGTFAFTGVNDPLDMAHRIELAQQHDPESTRFEAEQQGQGL